MVTILLGSLLAPIVISFVQNRNSRNDQALAEYKQYLQLQQNSVKETYDLVGRIVYSAQDLITLTKPTFDLTTLKGNDKQETEKQAREMLSKYNDTIREWRVKENVQGVLISYYFYGHPQVAEVWRSTETAVNDFIACAQDIHENFIENKTVTSDDLSRCQQKKEAIGVTLDRFAQSIEISRQYTWQQLDLPNVETVHPLKIASPALSPTPTPGPSANGSP